MKQAFNIEILEKKDIGINIRKLLIIYTGGTFGMVMGNDGKLSIKDQKSSLSSILKQIPEFFDKKEYALSDKKYMITDIFLDTRVYYNIIQFENLLDSSDSTPEFILSIVKIIKDNYNNYDSFVIIHGTDSMEYTGSALSFLIRNTLKTIIITGSQIPLSMIRNDAYTNLQGCFRIAARFNIPEVCLYFRNKLLRANCTLKFDVEKFGAFGSTIPPLIEDDMNFKVNTKLIRKTEDKYVKFYNKLSKSFIAVKMNSNYTNQFWTLIFEDESLEAILMYLEEGFQEFSFGDDFFLNALIKFASTKIFYLVLPAEFVNSQQEIQQRLIQNKVIINSYITYTAAICKISFLLGNYDIKGKKIRNYLQQNLRGEMNIPEYQKIIQDSDKNAVFKMFDKISNNIDKDHKDDKSSVLASISDYILKKQLKGFSSYLYKNNKHLHYKDIDEKYALLNNIPNMSVEFAKYLHNLKVSFNQKDEDGKNCCYLALLYENYQLAEFLYENNYKPIAPCIAIFQDMSYMIENDQLPKFKKFIKFGLNDCNQYLDYDKTNLGMIALKENKRNFYDYLLDFSCLNVYQKNIAGESCHKIIFGQSFISESKLSINQFINCINYFKFLQI